jgi:hypothetical protein
MSDDNSLSGSYVPTVLPNAEEAALSFQVEWESEIHLRRLADAFLIDVVMNSTTLPRQFAGTVGISSGVFDGDVDAANAWLQRTIEIVRLSYTDAVKASIMMLLTTASNRAMIDLGISPFDVKVLLKDQMSFMEQALRHQFGMTPGRAPMWRPMELSVAIAEAMQRIPIEEEITYDSVVAIMREMIPERAPFSGESLRKMLKPLGISWKKLKADAARRKRKASRSRVETEKRSIH